MALLSAAPSTFSRNLWLLFDKDVWIVHKLLHWSGQMYVKPERVLLKAHPELNEKWVQARIADDPSILGLGELILRDQERIQPRAGRLDLLLQDEEKRRYEVELQLGASDEAHIIRTIEYWDIERKRYPQYDHCAVLIAEDITSRFLNVVSLLNGTVPLIALQMQAYNVGEHLTLVFTKVIDELSRGLVDEDEDAEAAPTDRSYWETIKGSPETVAMADQCLEIVKAFDHAFELKYNKFYIGLARSGRAFNFATFRPKKKHMILEVGLNQSEDVDSIIAEASLETLEYSKQWGTYRIRLEKGDVKKHSDALRELMRLAFEYKSA